MNKPINDPPAVDKKNTFPDIQAVGSLSRDGVFVYHIAMNRFLYMNSSLERILEINSELLKQDPALVFSVIIEEDHDYMRSHFAEVLEKGLIEEIHLRIHQHRTEKILSCNCYLNADKACIIGFIKDISKPKEHEDYLVNFGAKKDAILDMVSQRLSTPLYLSKFTPLTALKKRYRKENSANSRAILTSSGM